MTTATHPTAVKRCTPKQVEQHIARSWGTIGHVEQLGGVNICDAAERRALWWMFQEHFGKPGVDVWQLVRAECHRRTARMVNAGALSLYPRAAA